MLSDEAAEALRPFLADRVFVLVWLMHFLLDQLPSEMIEAGIESSLGGPTKAHVTLDGHRYVISIREERDA